MAEETVASLTELLAVIYTHQSQTPWFDFNSWHFSSSQSSWSSFLSSWSGDHPIWGICDVGPSFLPLLSLASFPPVVVWAQALLETQVKSFSTGVTLVLC